MAIAKITTYFDSRKVIFLKGRCYFDIRHFAHMATDLNQKLKPFLLPIFTPILPRNDIVKYCGFKCSTAKKIQKKRMLSDGCTILKTQNMIYRFHIH